VTTFADYDQYDALGLAGLVEAGETTPLELVEAAIARAEAISAKLNPFAHKMYEDARNRASRELPSGPFRGVPFLVKDLIQRIPGVPTQMGSRFWQAWIPDEPTELYRRWLNAGVVPFAKTTTPELGIPPITEAEVNGPTRNPWNPGRTPGGSSGGSGVAVATRVVPMASGGDGGGSIRIPASCCGVFGLKPTRARNPAGPFASEHWSGFVSEHVLSVSVRDSAAMLDATQGIEPTSPYAAPAMTGTFLDAATTEPRKLRIGFHCDPAFPVETHRDCVSAVGDAARLCEELGHEVEEVRPEHSTQEISRAFVTVYAANIAADIREGEQIRNRRASRRDFEVATWVARLLAQSINSEDLMVASRFLQAEARRLVERFGAYDAILTPTLCKPPVPIGALEPKGLEARLQQVITATGLKAPLKLPGVVEQAVIEILRFAGFTQVANFTGQPSMSVPLFWGGEGLPIGVMFTGRFGDEQTLFGLAAQLERARPWADRRPPHFS
jgi:amidase